jgi:hypothetical protein
MSMGDPVLVMARRRRRLRAILLKPMKHFGYARKHDLCLAIRGGMISKAEAMRAHAAAAAEIEEWLATFDAVCAGSRRDAA